MRWGPYLPLRSTASYEMEPGFYPDEVVPRTPPPARTVGGRIALPWPECALSFILATSEAAWMYPSWNFVGGGHVDPQR